MSTCQGRASKVDQPSLGKITVSCKQQFYQQSAELNLIRLSFKRGFGNSPSLFKCNFGLLKLFYQLCNLKNNTQYKSRKIVLAVDVSTECVF